VILPPMAWLTPTPPAPPAPPRAGRSAGFWRAWFAFQRRLRIGRTPTPPRLARAVAGIWELDGAAFALALAVPVVPALGLRLAGPPVLRRFGPPALFVALFVAAGAYGQNLGGYAFGLALALHAAGVAAFFEARFPSASIAVRFLRPLALTLVIGLLAPPFVGSLARRVVIPVETEHGVLLINPRAVSAPRPGETVAYLLPRVYFDGAYIAAGTYLGRVLAGPGAEVTFAPGVYRVNGAPAPALPNMPESGVQSVGPGQAFIWPSGVGFRGWTGKFDPAWVVVPDSALVGRPYHRWFWRTQQP
jgi:hypothetical protein